MAREKIQIDLEATDKASQKIDKVADKAEALENLSPEVEVTADDKASDDLTEVSQKAQQVDALSPSVEVSADTGRFDSAIAGLKGAASGLTGTLGGAAAALSGPGGIAVGAVAAGGALFAMANKTTDAAIEANALKEAVGGTTEETSRLIAATSRVGLRYNDVLELIAESNKAMSENADLAEGLGVALDGTPIERFRSLVDIVYQIPDPLERSRVASKFFGEEGSKQLPRLIGLYGNLTNALEAVNENEVLSQEDVDNAVEYRQAMADLTSQVSSFASEMAREVVPILSTITKALADTKDLVEVVFGDGGAKGAAGLEGRLERVNRLSEEGVSLFDEEAIAASDAAANIAAASAATLEAGAATRAMGDAWAAAEGDVTSGMEEFQRQQQEITDAQAADARELGDAWAAAEGDIGGAMEATAEATAAAAEEVERLNSAWETALGLSGDLDRLNDDYLDGLASLQEDVKAATDAATDDADAQRNRGLVIRDSLDNALAMAQAEADRTAATLEGSDASVIAVESDRAFRDSLLRSAQVAGPGGEVANAILFHIQNLDSIPEEVATEIAAALAEGDLARAEELIAAFTGIPREVPIEPELVGEGEFENQLAHLTRERQMHIRGVLSGTAPLEKDSLHLTDLETGQESGVIPDEHLLALEVDGADAIATLAASQQAIADAEAAAREAGGEFTSALEVLEPALRNLDQIFSLGAISQETYLEHLRAHQAAYQQFSVEWVAITQRIQREEERINGERQREAEQAAAEQKRIADQQLADRQRLTDQVRGAFTGAGDLVSEFAGAEGPVTAAGIQSFLQGEATAAADFGNLIFKLRKTRLSPNVIEALALAGPEALPVAKALASATAAQIESINQLLFQLFKTGGLTAQNVGKALGIPGFQLGGIFHAPSPGGAGLAVLHDGERVIPRNQAGVTNQTITINTRQPVDETIRQVRRYTRLNGEVRVS